MKKNVDLKLFLNSLQFRRLENVRLSNLAANCFIESYLDGQYE